MLQGMAMRLEHHSGSQGCCRPELWLCPPSHARSCPQLLHAELRSLRRVAGVDDCRGAGLCAEPGVHRPPLAAMLPQAAAQAGASPCCDGRWACCAHRPLNLWFHCGPAVQCLPRRRLPWCSWRKWRQSPRRLRLGLPLKLAGPNWPTTCQSNSCEVDDLTSCLMLTT